MKATKNRTRVMTGMLALAIVSLTSCSVGESPSSQVTQGGSAALQGPLVFVHNSTARTTSIIALRGDMGNSVIRTMGNGIAETDHPNGAYNGNAPGDMQFSEGEWIFVNVGGNVPGGAGVTPDNVGSRVALIDPLSGATPIFEVLLQIGERPAHIYRDPTDGEVIWSMIDGNATTGLDSVSATIKDSGAVVDCSATGGGAVTILHNSHIPSGGNVPKIIGKVCLLAAGHKVTAFSSGAGVPRRTFISSQTTGEIAVIDNEETLAAGGVNPKYLKLIDRIDLCTNDGEALNGQGVCDVNLNLANSPNTPNKSNPHGIRFSSLTKKIYSIQEGYRTIVEIDPDSHDIINTFNLSGTPYTGFGITPNGRYLILRGIDITTSLTRLTGKIAVYDLSTTPATKIEFDLPDLSQIVPGSFKMAPDGNKLYLLAANSAPTSGPIVPNSNQVADMVKDRLFVYDLSVLPSTPSTPQIFSLLSTNGNHSLDIYTDGPSGAGSAKYVVVSNGSPANSVSIINATTNFVAQPVPVGNGAGTIMVYYPDAAFNNNQATASLTGGSRAKPSLLPERLDDHGMPE
jgi:hypothetical protein